MIQVFLRKFAGNKTTDEIMKNMKKGTLLMFALLLMGATVTKAQSEQPDFDDKYATELVKAGTVAPDFKMKTPDGKTIQFAKFAKGKTVVLDFWASWCPDCRKDAPEVVRLYEKYRQHGIEFIGISMDTDVEAWQKAIEKYGITYPQVSELKKFKETDIAKAYGVKWIPSMVVVGPDGQVKLSTVLTYKVDKYLKELTTGKYTGPGKGETVFIDGDHGRRRPSSRSPRCSRTRNARWSSSVTDSAARKTARCLNSWPTLCRLTASPASVSTSTDTARARANSRT